MPARGIGRSGRVGAVHPRSTKTKRGEDSVRNLSEREVGVMFWAGRDNLEEIASLGVRCGQLGIPGDLDLNANLAREWKAALEQTPFSIATVFAAYTGEDYADIPTV